MEKPIEFKDDIGGYGECVFDSWSGKPVGWGFRILTRLGEEKWRKLAKLGELVCHYPEWCLVTKKLTREEAIEQYGKITDEEFGPRGGWHSVTFGKTKFSSRWLAPEM